MENENLYEEPISIIPKNDPFKIQANTPKGTSYNKKTTMLIIVGIIIAFGIVILISISMNKKKLDNTQMVPPLDNKQVVENQSVTSDSIQKMPSSYASQRTTVQNPGQSQNLSGPTSVNQQFKWQQNPNTQQGPISASTQSNNYRNNNSGRSGNLNNIPQPPVLKPVNYEPTTRTQVGQQNGLSTEQQELIQVQKSQLRFNASTGSSNSNTTKTSLQDVVMDNINRLAVQFSKQNQGDGQSQTASSNQPEGDGALAISKDQNWQDEKRNFSSQKSTNAFYATSTITQPLSPYEVKAGSVIPVVLVTGINSDLPGNIIAQVRENVYDTVSGRYLLIPQGTKVIGVYDSKVAYAQNRVLIVWSRMLFANGNSLDLQNISGADVSGYSGLTDKVNNHYTKLMMGVLLTSVLGATAEVANNSSSSNSSYGALAAQGAASSLQQTGDKLVEKNLNIQPTLEIRPGYRFNLFVDKDFILKPYK